MKAVCYFFSIQQQETGIRMKTQFLYLLIMIISIMAFCTSAIADNQQLVQSLKGQLVKSGWDADAALAVIELNQDWFAILQQEDGQELANEISVLQKLGRYKQLTPILQTRPEIAGLLAASANPELIAQSLDSPEYYTLTAGLYVRHVAQEDSLALAQALDRNHDLIAKLHERGLTWIEMLFVFKRDTPGSKEYDAWLREVLCGEVSAPDNRLASILNFLITQGPDIRFRLNSEDNFRRDFRTVLWPKLNRVAEDMNQQFEALLGNPHVWDMLTRSDGEKLLRRTGLLAVDLLYGNQKWPERLHTTVIQMLLEGDKTTLDALSQFGQEPLFHNLLQRSLSTKTRDVVFSKLFQADCNYPSLLQYYDSLSDAALEEEMADAPAGLKTFVPGYGIYYAIKKGTQGRTLQNEDALNIAMDLLTFFPVAKSIKGGEKLLKQALVSDAKKNLSKASKIVTKEMLEKTAENNIKPWIIHHALAKLPSELRSFSPRLMLDITASVQVMFRITGIGRASYRILTGLEARLFMRKDARVFLNIRRAVNKVFRMYLRRTLRKALGAKVDDQGQEDDSNEQIIIEAQKNENMKLPEVSRAWQQHVAVWWLVNASRSLSDEQDE